jgi:hypothetical protein
MGMVTITINGSFPRTSTLRFSAEQGGHAQCLQKAIKHLVDQLPAAIKADHALDRAGSKPEVDFGDG